MSQKRIQQIMPVPDKQVGVLFPSWRPYSKNGSFSNTASQLARVKQRRHFLTIEEAETADPKVKINNDEDCMLFLLVSGNCLVRTYGCSVVVDIP